MNKASLLSTLVLTSFISLATAFAADPTHTTVVAKVNGHDIPFSKVTEEIRRQPVLGYKMSLAKDDAAKVKEVQKQAVDAIIERELLLEASVKSKALPDAEVTKSVNEFIKANYQSEENLSKLLKGMGTPIEQFKKELGDDFRIKGYLQKTLTQEVKPTEQDLKKVFDENPTRYAAPESVHARHILIKVEQNAPKDKVEASEKKINELYAQVTKPGADFGEVAKKSSECPSAPSGGDLGSFNKGAMVPEFEKVAFATKPGEISKPLRTQFGFHIIKVEGHKDASAPDFAAAKPSLERDFVIKKRIELVKAHLVELKKTAKIQVMI